MKEVVLLFCGDSLAHSAQHLVILEKKTKIFFTSSSSSFSSPIVFTHQNGMRGSVDNITEEWEDEVKQHLSFVFLFIFYIKICDRRRQCLPCRAGSLGWYSVSSVSRTMTVPAQPLAAPLGGIRRIPTSIHIASRWRSNHLACTPELDRGRPMLVDGQGRSRRNSSLQNWTQICIGLQIMSRKCKNLPTSYSFSGRDLLISLFPSIACRFTSKCDQIHSASLLINGDWTVFSSFPKPVQCLPGLLVCRFLFGAVWSA